MFCPVATLQFHGCHSSCQAPPSTGTTDRKRISFVSQPRKASKLKPIARFGNVAENTERGVHQPSHDTSSSDDLATLPPEMAALFGWMQLEVVGRLAHLDQRLENLSLQLDASVRHTVEPKDRSLSAAFQKVDLREVSNVGKVDLREVSNVGSVAAPMTPRQSPTLLASPCLHHHDNDAPIMNEKIIESSFHRAKSPDSASLRLPSGDVLVDMIDAPAIEKSEGGFGWAASEANGHAASDDRQTSSQTASTCLPCDDQVHVVGETCPGDDSSVDRVSSQRSNAGSGLHSRRPSQSSIGSVADLAKLVKKRTGWVWRERAWIFLDDPESSRSSQLYLNAMACFSLLAMSYSLLQGAEWPAFQGTLAATGEAVFEYIFLFEFLIRFCVCPERQMFFKNVFNLFDLAAILPLGLRIAVSFVLDPNAGAQSFCRDLLVGIVPVLRVLKTLRAFKHFQLLVTALSLCLEALPVCIFSVFALTLIFSAVIYMVEPRDNIETLPRAMWFTIVTMTTLGYGDILPTTVVGSMVLAVVVVSGVMYMAMPLAIIGQAFSEVWKDRDRTLLVHSVRNRLLHWGYKATDIPALFDVFDDDGSGELCWEEFRYMLREMHIGLSDQRGVNLFQSIDVDGSGSIDAKELVQALFPQMFKQIFPEEPDDEVRNKPASVSDSPASVPISPRQEEVTDKHVRKEAPVSDTPLASVPISLPQENKKRKDSSVNYGC